MNFSSTSTHTGILTITLGELIEEYQKPKKAVYPATYICFLLDEIGSRNFIRKDGGENTGCLDDEQITEQFRVQWFEKVLGREYGGIGETIEKWNEGTRYSVLNYGWASYDGYFRDGNSLVCPPHVYRLAMLRDVLGQEGDMEFKIKVSVCKGMRELF